MRRSGVAFGVAAAVLAGGVWADEGHLTLDTPTGEAGEALMIVAGYLPPEDHFSIGPDGRLMHDGEILTIRLYDNSVFDGFVDWNMDVGMTLTSDFFSLSGRLDGGDFSYEITDVATIVGAVIPTAGWISVEGGEVQVSARSDGASRAERSFHVGFDGHPEGQFMLVDKRGLYDVTIQAWDANAVYADSSPVIIRVQSGQCIADFDGNGVPNSLDFLEYLNTYNRGDLLADVNSDGVLNTLDFLVYLNAFVMGCP